MKKIIFILLVLIIGCKKDIVVFDSEINESFELPLILSFNGKNCFFDEPSKTFKYSISENELNSFKPFTEFQEYSNIKLNSISLKNNAKNNLTDLDLNTAYSLEIETNNEIYSFSLIFTSLPLVRVVVADNIKNNYKSLAKMVVNKPDQQTFNSFIGIEIRGKSSTILPKKSYGLKLLEGSNMDKEKISTIFSNLKPNHKWSLDAMYSDESKIRNQVNFKIWESMGYQTIKANYVEVFINNQSHGLYRFSENYTASYLNMNNSSVLYTGFENSGYTKFEKVTSKLPNKGVWGDWEQVYPDDSKIIEWQDFYSLSHLIVEETDDNFANNIENHIDIDNVIDYYLFINLYFGYDSAGKNWFFYKNNKVDKFTFLVWDMDYSWGRKHNGELISYNALVKNEFFTRLLSLNPNSFKTRLKNRWNNLRNYEFSKTTLLNLFEENYNLIQSYEIIEFENKIWNTEINLSTEKAYTDTWLENRLYFMDNYINDL